MYLTANRSSATLAKRVNQVKMQIGEKYQNIKLEKDEEELRLCFHWEEKEVG